MLAQVPAGLHAGVREQRVHAGFSLWRIEDELRLSVLLKNGVVVVHCDRSVSVVVRRCANPEDRKVHAEGQKGHRKDHEQRAEKNPT